jgi:hypothetical protein
MKNVLGLMLVLTLIIGAAPAYAVRVSQVFSCEQDDDATEQQINAGAAKWLEAAKGMKGGENLEAWVYYPVAVNDMGESDLLLILVAPSFEEWGMFWDSYEGSPAAKVDKENQEFVVCPDSALWETVPVK